MSQTQHPSDMPSLDECALITLSLYKGTKTRMGVPPVPTNTERLAAYRQRACAAVFANTTFNFGATKPA